MPATLENLEIIIEDIQKNLPEFLRPIDLINCGLFKSRSDVAWAMKRGKAPPSIKLGSYKVVFPRISLVNWLREKSIKENEENIVKRNN